MTVRVSRSVTKSLFAGLVVAASMPPWGWWPLAFLGIAWFHGTSRTAESRRGAFALGAVFCLGWLLPATAWMWFISAPGWIVACILFAALHGLAETLVWRTERHVVLQPLAHVLVEALRFSWPFGGVPLASLAISQSQSPVVSLTRVVGVIGVTWFVWQAATFLRARKRGVVPMVLAALVVVAIAPTGSAVDGSPEVRVAVVQGGGPQGTRAINTDPRVVHLRHLEVMRRIKVADKVDVVVWPENVIDVANFSSSTEFTEIAGEAKRLGVPVLVGVTEDAGPGRFTNRQVVVRADGSLGDGYDKVRRVPFGEYIPMRGVLRAIGAPVDQVPTDAVSGSTKALLEVPLGGPTISGDDVATLRVATAISWEVFFAGRVNEGVEEGASIVINPTNGSSYRGTILQTQQLASSRLRAIESGRYVVQAAPTGFSGFISSGGEIVSRTRIGEAALIVSDVPLRTGRTWYSRLGDAPVIVALLGAFALVSYRSRRRGGEPTRR
ncbi:MAG: apolipoprotein N-acyltransferase [Actinomycetota bacterium]